MADFTDEELKRMQNEAKKRVQEMQKRAKLTYDTAQGQSRETEEPSVSPPEAVAAPVCDGHAVELLLRILQPAQDPVLDAMLGLLRATDTHPITKTFSFPQ